MKTTYYLKLKRPIVFSFILTIILGLTAVNAQIIYTDIEPDFVSQSSGTNY